MTTVKSVFAVFLGLFLAIQLIKPTKSDVNFDSKNEIKTDDKIKTILKTSCYDCHSNNTKWPWYSNVAPISWLTISHVNDARKWMNFSEWESYDGAKKEKLKKLIYREVYGAMPPHIYTMVHGEATLSDNDKKLLRDWTGVEAKNVSMRD